MLFPITVLLCFFKPCTMADTDDICPDDMQLFKRPDGTLDCLYCRVCAAGTIKTKNCSLDHDTECTKCYRSAQRGDVGNTCNPCGICEPGSYLQKNCTEFNDTVCSLCPSGTFSATQNVERCSDCGICIGMMITKTECTNSTDVVCKKKKVPLETAAVIIAIVAGILEGIATIIFIVVIIIKYRKKFNKQWIENVPEEQAMVYNVQTRDHNMETDNTDKRKAENKQNKTKGKIMLKDFNVGVLVMNDGHQDETRKQDKAGKGQGSPVQTRPIIVLRIGMDYGITALQALKNKMNPGQGEHKTGYTKLKADNVYIEFHTDDNVIKCRVSSDTPVFEDDDLDIVVLKIKQDDSEPSSIHDPPVLKLTASDILQEPELQLYDLKTKISNGKEREFNFKNVSLREGYDGAINILENVLENTMLKYIQDQDKKGVLKSSINELGSNLYTKGSEHLENISDDLKNNEKLKEIISAPTDPKDVTTIFVRGEYSSGCPVFTYDDSGNLQVYCILTHRVPRIFDVLNENNQKLYFTDIQEVTAGTKITAIYKALRKANQKRLINAVFESDN